MLSGAIPAGTYENAKKYSGDCRWRSEFNIYAFRNYFCLFAFYIFKIFGAI